MKAGIYQRGDEKYFQKNGRPEVLRRPFFYAIQKLIQFS